MLDRKPHIWPISSLDSDFNPPESEVRDSEIRNVFFRLKLSSTLNSAKFAEFRLGTTYHSGKGHQQIQWRQNLVDHPFAHQFL